MKDTFDGHRLLAPCYGLLWLITLSVHAAVTPTPLPTPAAPAISAASAVLLDYQSGKILAEQQADARCFPASLVKIMTSYVLGQAFKAGTIHPTDKVTISSNAWGKKFSDSSKMFIEVGKQVTAADLHNGIIISSGNDACVAMAEHLAGSEQGFVALMNHYAAKLQLSNTQFANVHGLDHPDQYSSARDMARLAVALMTDLPDEYVRYSEKTFSYNGITQKNRNTLLWDPSLNVDGVKTGQTSQAGFNLVASATEGERRLIAVVLGASSTLERATACRQLLRWGFRFFDSRLMLDAGETVTTTRVWLSQQKAALGVVQPHYLTLPRSQSNRVTTRTVVTAPLKAPLTQHQIVGHICFELDGQLLEQHPLYVLHPVAQGSLLTRCCDTLTLWWYRMTHRVI